MERKVTIQQLESSLVDQEFDSVRERFESEMGRMEEEMARFRSQLIEAAAPAKKPPTNLNTSHPSGSSEQDSSQQLQEQQHLRSESRMSTKSSATTTTASTTRTSTSTSTSKTKTTRQLRSTTHQALDEGQQMIEREQRQQDDAEELKRQMTLMFKDQKHDRNFRGNLSVLGFQWQKWLEEQELASSPLIQEDRESGQKMLRLRFDVAQYKPEQILVKTIDSRLQVSAKRELFVGNSSSYSEYNREFLLPEGIDVNLIRSSLSAEGVLTVEVPLPQAMSAVPQLNTNPTKAV